MVFVFDLGKVKAIHLKNSSFFQSPKLSSNESNSNTSRILSNRVTLDSVGTKTEYSVCIHYPTSYCDFHYFLCINKKLSMFCSSFVDMQYRYYFCNQNQIIMNQKKKLVASKVNRNLITYGPNFLYLSYLLHNSLSVSF